jgi:predicted TIM-barrel enzyme
LTTGGSIGAGAGLALADCVPMVADWSQAARAVREDVIVLVHGGPVAEPDDARYMLEHCDVQGFYGASSMERLPTERALTAQTREFTQIRLR